MLKLASPLLAIAFTYALCPTAQGRPLTFIIEAFGVWAFAAYWLVKSRELSETGAEWRALEGKVEAAVPFDGQVAAAVRLVQVEPDDAAVVEWLRRGIWIRRLMGAVIEGHFAGRSGAAA